MKKNVAKKQNEKEKEKYVCPQIEVLEMECEQLLVDSSTGASIPKMSEDNSGWD